MADEELTKQQKKNRKKREAAKKKKHGVDGASNNANQEDNPPAESISASQPQPVFNNNNEKMTDQSSAEEDNFENELCWCIQQIQLGLKTQKPTKDQTVKSTKLMEQLQSKKTPKPKKRMLMKTNFGNYRDKMEKEKKQLLQVKTAKFTEVNDKVMNKSVFFKKKMKDLPPVETDGKEQEFRFNFSDDPA